MYFYIFLAEVHTNSMCDYPVLLKLACKSKYELAIDDDSTVSKLASYKLSNIFLMRWSDESILKSIEAIRENIKHTNWRIMQIAASDLF